MSETIALTSPVSTTRNMIRLTRLIVDVEGQSVTCEWASNLTNEAFSASYPTPAPVSNPTQPTGAALISSLNIANLSTISLVKRVLQRLQTDGYIAAGAISGSPS